MKNVTKRFFKNPFLFSLLSFFVIFYPNSGSALLCKGFLGPSGGPNFSFPKTKAPKNTMFYMSRTPEETFRDLNFPESASVNSYDGEYLKVAGLPHLLLESSTKSDLIFRLPLGLRVKANHNKNFYFKESLSDFRLLPSELSSFLFGPKLLEYFNASKKQVPLTEDLIRTQSLLQAEGSNTYRSGSAPRNKFIESQSLAFRVLISLLVSKKELSSSDISAVNKIIIKLPDLRNQEVAPEEVGFLRGEVLKSRVFIPSIDLEFIPSTEVSKALNVLIEKINTLNDDSSLLEVARLYQNFILIHPFIDGNGRTGRALLDYMLLKSGFPPLKHKETTEQIIFLTPLELSLLLLGSLG